MKNNINTLLVEKIISLSELMNRVGQTHVFANTSLTPLQFNILGEIILHNGLTINTLKEKLILSASSLSQLLGRMEKTGLIERHLTTKDKREIFLTPTHTARALYKDLNEKYIALADEKLGSLSDAEKQDMINFLEKIKKSLDF